MTLKRDWLYFQQSAPPPNRSARASAVTAELVRLGRVAKWISRQTSDLKIVGSIPTVLIFFHFFASGTSRTTFSFQRAHFRVERRSMEAAVDVDVQGVEVVFCTFFSHASPNLWRDFPPRSISSAHHFIVPKYSPSSTWTAPGAFAPSRAARRSGAMAGDGDDPGDALPKPSGGGFRIPKLAPAPPPAPDASAAPPPALDAGVGSDPAAAASSAPPPAPAPVPAAARARQRPRARASTATSSSST